MVVLNEGSDSCESCPRSHRVAHRDVALQSGVLGECFKGLGYGDAFGCPVVHHFGVVGEHHVADADRIPVTLFVIWEAQKGISVFNFDRFKITGFFQFKGESRLGDEHHVAAQGSGFHLAVNLCD